MGNGGSPDATKVDMLGEFRKFDQKNEQGEVLPENETLNAMRIRFYLENRGFTPENFNDRWKVNNAIDMLSLRPTRGETEMADLIKKGSGVLANLGLTDLFERTDEASFKSTLHKELLTRNLMAQEAELVKSYLTYHTVRKLAERTLIIKKRMQEQMEAQKTELGSTLKDQVGGVLNEVKKNFNKMSLTQKGILVGGLLALGIWVGKSDNDTVKDIRNGIWDVVKYGGLAVGGGLLANSVYQVATGKSALDSISDWIGGSTGRQDFWKETFGTDSERADIIRKSVVYLGDKDFLDLAQRYREAKANGSKRIDLPTVLPADMKPEEIYTACEVFFSKYPVEKLEPKYRNFTPRPNWLDVVSVELCEDGTIKYSGDLLKRTYEAVESGAIRSWNWIWVGEGFGVLKALYLKVHGKPAASDAEVTKWAKESSQLENDVDDDRSLDELLDKKTATVHSGVYKRALKSTETVNAFPGIKYMIEGGFIYVVSRANILNIADNQKSIADAMTLAHQTGLSFLNTKYPEKAAETDTKSIIDAGTRVKGNSSYVVFMRMPV